ncbi:putative carnitine operon oxidoreductase [Escherichia coli]|nr:putative carnitine operon oxidoreductase [Escherichia coli]
MTNYVNCKNSEGSGNYRKLLKSEQKNIGNDSNLLIVFYVQIMPDDFVMQLHRF